MEQAAEQLRLAAPEVLGLVFVHSAFMPQNPQRAAHVVDLRARTVLHVPLQGPHRALADQRRLAAHVVEATFATNHPGDFLDFDDLPFERRAYSPFGGYGASKLANLLFTAELGRRLEGSGVTANALHSGVIASNFGQTGLGWMRFGTKLVAPLLTTPEKGALTSLHLATSPEVEGVNGKHWENRKQASPSREAEGAEAANRLRAASEALVARSALR